MKLLINTETKNVEFANVLKVQLEHLYFAKHYRGYLIVFKQGQLEYLFHIFLVKLILQN